MSHDKLDLKKLEQRIEALENLADNNLSNHYYYFRKGSPEHLEFEKLRKAHPERYQDILLVLGPTVEESAQWQADYDQRHKEVKTT